MHVYQEYTCGCATYCLKTCVGNECEAQVLIALLFSSIAPNLSTLGKVAVVVVCCRPVYWFITFVVLRSYKISKLGAKGPLKQPAGP